MSSSEAGPRWRKASLGALRRSANSCVRRLRAEPDEDLELVFEFRDDFDDILAAVRISADTMDREIVRARWRRGCYFVRRFPATRRLTSSSRLS
jgi:hypothetical protein